MVNLDFLFHGTVAACIDVCIYSLVLALHVSVVCRHAVFVTAGVYKLYLHNQTTSTTTTVKIIRTATPATAAPAASPTGEELVSGRSVLGIDTMHVL